MACQMRSLQPSETSRLTGELVTIPVTYDGADLADVAESTGLSEFWLKHANQEVIIPMRGKIDSMNVSNAAAILIFEALRQRDIS